MRVLVVIFTEPFKCKYKSLFYSQLKKIPSKIFIYTTMYRNIQFFPSYFIKKFIILNGFERKLQNLRRACFESLSDLNLDVSRKGAGFKSQLGYQMF